ncbi:MAG: hypothetical protein IJC80_02225, partial [Clostridia bacterium]|nr:hypothetical protein [Clostridia bacterium]
GPGDFFSSDRGVRQSGEIDLGIAKSCTDISLVHISFEAAKKTLERDPELSLPEHSFLASEVEKICGERVNTIN